MIKSRDTKQNREILSVKNYTLDNLQYKNLKLLQNKKGYRSSEDSLILLNIILENIGISFSGTAFEFGTGSCIIAILLAAKVPQISITAIEVQPSLFELAQKNVAKNHLDEKINLIMMDGKKVKTKMPSQQFDIAFSNPPFYPVGRGRLSPDEEKRNARHEILCTMDDVIIAFEHLLKESGLGFIIYPTFRWREFDDKVKSISKNFFLQKYYFFKGINKRFSESMFSSCSSANYKKIIGKSNLFVAKIRRLSKTAKLPEKMTPHSSGYDIFADLPKDVIILPKDIALIPTGFSLEIPQGYEAQIRPRSGLAINHKIGILNSPGTIDSDYRGEVKIITFNFGDENFIVKPNMRIAQMVFSKVEDTILEESISLSKTERDSGGFGHTDNKLDCK